MNKRALIIAGVSIVSVAAAVAAWNYAKIREAEQAALILAQEIAEMESVVENEAVYANIFIDDVNVGGMLEKEAREKLTETLNKELSAKKVLIKAGEVEREFEFRDFGYAFDIESALTEALSYARDGTLEERYEKVAELTQNPYKLSLTHEYDKSLIETALRIIAQEVDIPPVNASYSKAGDEFVIIEGYNGSALDVEATADIVENIIINYASGTAEAVFKSVPPAYTPDGLAAAQTLLGTGTTNYSGRGTGRVANMDNAAAKVNGTVLYPGEVFSTNDALGEMSISNGYAIAPVIEQGALVDGIGGGVCQVSSTLYIALLYSELEIVERTNHSLKVGYLDWAYDATLAEDYLDLKFKNNTEYPLYIECYLSTNQVIARVYGNESRSPSRRLAFRNQHVSTTQTNYVYDLYKLIYENDVFIEEVKVNRSVYRTGSSSSASSGSSNSGGLGSSASSAPAPANTPAPVEEPVTVAEELPAEPAVPEPEPAVPEPVPPAEELPAAPAEESQQNEPSAAYDFELPELPDESEQPAESAAE